MTMCAACEAIGNAVVSTDSGWLPLSHCLSALGYYTVVCPACAAWIDAERAKEMEEEWSVP